MLAESTQYIKTNTAASLTLKPDSTNHRPGRVAPTLMLAELARTAGADHLPARSGPHLPGDSNNSPG